VLLRLHTGNFNFEGVSDSGADLRFVAGDDKTVLNHQIEQFDPLLGIALIWVDVPALTAGTPQQFWMYYGNPKAPASGNGQRTFDPDYTLVYHFAEANVPARDTTAYGNNARRPCRHWTARDRPGVSWARPADAARLAAGAGRGRAVHVFGLDAPDSWARSNALCPPRRRRWC
jgi:hypothetical protein